MSFQDVYARIRVHEADIEDAEDEVRQMLDGDRHVIEYEILDQAGDNPREEVANGAD